MYSPRLKGAFLTGARLCASKAPIGTQKAHAKHAIADPTKALKARIGGRDIQPSMRAVVSEAHRL